PLPAAEVLIPGGPFVMGTDSEPFAYDNERPAHVVDVAPFFIDTVPVTNRQYLGFIEAGGYHDPRWWTEAGWAHRQEAALSAPQFWSREGAGAWSVRRYGQQIDLPLDEPVQHVTWYEADAYARFAGKRLPTEAEWEKAAAGASPAPGPGGWGVSPRQGRREPPMPGGWGVSPRQGRREPPMPGGWGVSPRQGRREPPMNANLGQRHFGPAPVGAYPDGASRYGVE